MEAFARNIDPETSKEAARFASENLSDLEAEVYRVIVSFGEEGCIADDVIQTMNAKQNSINPRFKPLKNKGAIVDTGLKRKADSGRNQIVVRASIFGGPVVERPVFEFDV